jgi:hypothetical protein
MDTEPVTVTLSEDEFHEIREWLEALGESPAAIAQDLETARAHPDTAAWLLARARAA